MSSIMMSRYCNTPMLLFTVCPSSTHLNSLIRFCASQALVILCDTQSENKTSFYSSSAETTYICSYWKLWQALIN